MPLLFILAGMSVYYALKSRSPSQFAKERMRKLLVPAVFGCVVLNPIMTYIYMVSKNVNISFANHLINFFTKNPGDLTGIDGGFTPAHLWFIIFLFVFSLAGLPIFILLNKKISEKFILGLATLLEKPLMLTFVIIPITILSLTDILGDKNPLVYFFMFIIGYFLVSDERYQKALNRDKWIYLLLSIILIYIKFNISSHNAPWSIQWIAYGLMDKATRIVPVFAIIGLANCFIDKNTAVLGYLSQASFAIYVIHMLINTVVGSFILRLKINVGIKYALIVLVTFILCFFVYEIIRRIKVLSFIFAIKKS